MRATVFLLIGLSVVAAGAAACVALGPSSGVVAPPDAAMQAPAPDAATCEGEVVATGHILVGNPLNKGFPSTNVAQGMLLGTVLVDGIDSFIVEGPARGATICTRTTNGSGLPYDLNVYFHTAAWPGLINERGCDTAQPDERCTVPLNAVRASVDAARGADLTVEIVRSA